MRASTAVMRLELPVRCTACPSDVSPHNVERELRYRRGHFRFRIPACDGRLIALLDMVDSDIRNVADFGDRLVELETLIASMGIEAGELVTEIEQRDVRISELETQLAAVTGGEVAHA